MMAPRSKKDRHEDVERVSDEIELEDVEELSTDALKRLREKLKVCQKERQEYLDGWQRAQADMMNAKRRLSEERERDTERIQASFVEKLLPLADSFEGAMQDQEVWEKIDPSWRKGIEQVHAQLERIFSHYNVERIGSVGDAFDPQIHDAVSNQPVTDEKQHHTVTAVLQSGYRMNSTVIRPARVTVGECST